ncbi:hypothetical protein IFM89_025435 [Coptis chinensis]|uniref:MHD1 domain-containing protein n=1 Tax=Coptis chinensis TaxID=261450 RepID=A0A835HPM4_9MAGN|nr:hypothetical protein IFM89_025435 [Coptis chinensis]
MIESPSRSYYFLCSNPELSGSPPHRVPPNVDTEVASDPHLYSLNQLDPPVTEEISYSGDSDAYRYANEADDRCPPESDVNLPSIEFPILRTGLSDDDCGKQLMTYCLLPCYSLERKEKTTLQPQTTESHYELLNVIRSQMQISEAMDICIRQRLMQFASTATCRQIDFPSILLELLNGIRKIDFPSEKLYIQWKKRQANVLEELLCYSSNKITDEHMKIRGFIAMIRSDEEWNTRISTSRHGDVLPAIKKFSLRLSSMPGKFGIPGETYYWTSAYHLNISLYEKLISCVFDILDEGQVVKEADEILKVIKLTWITLGINQKMHEALYGWVLFQKFVETGDTKLLDEAILLIQKVQSRDDDEKLAAYMDCFVCSVGIIGGKVSSNLIDAIFIMISTWCDKKLKDYHRHFSQKAMNFGRVLKLFLVVGHLASDGSGDNKLIKPNARTELAFEHLKSRIENSIQAACRRLTPVMDTKNSEPKSKGKHPMKKLADELKQIAEREFTVFIPVLCRWCPEAGMISSMQLHKFYGKELKPFLDGVTCLSDDVRSVLPAADVLDRRLSHLFYSAHAEDKLHSPISKDLDHYQIGEVCKPIILDWVNGQHMPILEWTERAFNLEVQLYCLQTVDQFFSLKLPMDVIHLQSLLSVIFQSLEAYLMKMATQLVKEHFSGPLEAGLSKCSGLVDGLLITFNKIRNDVADAINKICEIIGARLVFWDLRDSFLFTLYRGKVESARLESSLTHFDSVRLVLDLVCTMITDTLRDPVVLNICHESMDFFVADGDGLPPAVVEHEARLAQNIIKLYSLQSETLIEMLMMASEQGSTTSDCSNPDGWSVEDAHTVLRVLCHKKDNDASKFLKKQYQLPKSSEYEDVTTVSPPLISDLLKRSKSSQWAKKSQRSFRSLTKKFQEATSEIRHGAL